MYNLNSHGKWITCYVALPEGYDVKSVDTTTIALNNIIYPDRTHIKDCDGDGIEDLMVKFSRDLVCAVLEPSETVTLTVSGKITERVYFEGADTIRVIDKRKQSGKEKAKKNGHRTGWDDLGSAVPRSALAECFVYYCHLDHLGTPQVMTDEQGEVVWQADYLPFGAADVVGMVENKFRFPGQHYDQETGLHYNYFRYYNPATGRYLKPDPIGVVGGINLYTYVLNNPNRYIDPRGLCEGSPANTAKRKAIDRIASSYDKSKTWAYSERNDNFPPNSWKCSKFVYDVVKEAGAPAHATAMGKSRHPTACEWANTLSDIPTWRVLDPDEEPQPGDIAAYKLSGGGNSFCDHAGIMISDGRGGVTNISAHKYSVGTDPGQFKNEPSTVYRRYTGD